MRRGAAGQGQQKAAQKGRVHARGTVGDPDRRDRVFLQGAVDPPLLLTRPAAAEEGQEEVVGLEDVLHLVEDQQGVAAAGQEALGQQVGRQLALRAILQQFRCPLAELQGITGQAALGGGQGRQVAPSGADLFGSGGSGGSAAAGGAIRGPGVVWVRGHERTPHSCQGWKRRLSKWKVTKSPRPGSLSQITPSTMSNGSRK